MSVLKTILEDYENRVSLASKIRNVVILCGSITDDQLKKKSSITMLYNGIQKLGVKVYMFHPEKIQFINSNGNYTISHNKLNLNISPNDSVIFYRRSKPEPLSGLNLLKELQTLGFICINNYESFELCNNKYLTSKTLEKLNINTPKTILVNKSMKSDEILSQVKNTFKSYPLIVKILDGSKGIGVSIVESERSLISVVQSLLANNDAGVLIQEYLENDGDYRLHIVNGKVIAIMKREPNKGKSEFRANLALGGSAKGIEEAPKDMTNLAIAAHNATGAIWTGVDILKDKKSGKYYVIEVNASAGLQGISEVVHKDIIKTIFDELKFTHQSEITGIFDKITIEGIGEFTCLLDTGNLKRSMSLGAKIIDIDEEKKKVKFEVDNKVFTDDIEKFIRVKDNGSSNKDSDRRAVIKHNVIFRNKVYNDVLIDLNDRSHKKYQVLVNYDFIKLAKIIIKPE